MDRQCAASFIVFEYSSGTAVVRCNRCAAGLGPSLPDFKPGLIALDILERTVSTEIDHVVEPAGAYINNTLDVGIPPLAVPWGRPKSCSTIGVQPPLAGQGSGVAFQNSTKTPEYMLMLRAGTGPGVGYTKFRQVLIIKNKDTFDEMTTVGFDVEASANATFKVGKFGDSQLYSGSFNPYLEVYTITDAGIDLQANWGGVEYIKNPGLD